MREGCAEGPEWLSQLIIGEFAFTQAMRLLVKRGTGGGGQARCGESNDGAERIQYAQLRSCMGGVRVELEVG